MKLVHEQTIKSKDKLKLLKIIWRFRDATLKIRAEKINYSINGISTTMQPHGKENRTPTHTKNIGN